MSGTKTVAGLAVLLLAAPAWGQRLPLPDPNAVAVGKSEAAVPAVWTEITGTAGRLVTLKSLNGQSLLWELVDDKAADLVPAADGKTAAFVAPVDGTYRVIAYACDKPAVRVKVLVGPRPPPKPDEPDVVPPPVVKSFRVILVYESGSTLPAAQTAILTAKPIRDYLQKKTTPENGLAGFRVWDQNASPERDQPTMAKLWAAVKPNITTVPCVVVEVNGKADIYPLPANVAEALAKLKTYGGE